MGLSVMPENIKATQVVVTQLKFGQQEIVQFDSTAICLKP